MFTSITAAFVAPRRFWVPEETLGQISSPSVLPTTMRSSAAASTPAQASARAAATWIRSPSGTWEMRRSCIPVRETIQASSVSRKVARSPFVITAGGRHFPQPMMAAWMAAGASL